MTGRRPRFRFDRPQDRSTRQPSRQRITDDRARRRAGSLAGEESAAWDIAINEYQRLRSLSLGEKALVTALDRSGVLLSGWTWLQWLHLERRSFADARAVEHRLNLILKRLEHLVESLL